MLNVQPRSHRLMGWTHKCNLCLKTKATAFYFNFFFKKAHHKRKIRKRKTAPATGKMEKCIKILWVRWRKIIFLTIIPPTTQTHRRKIRDKLQAFGISGSFSIFVLWHVVDIHNLIVKNRLYKNTHTQTEWERDRERDGDRKREPPKATYSLFIPC